MHASNAYGSGVGALTVVGLVLLAGAAFAASLAHGVLLNAMARDRSALSPSIVSGRSPDLPIGVVRRTACLDVRHGKRRQRDTEVHGRRSRHRCGGRIRGPRRTRHPEAARVVRGGHLRGTRTVARGGSDKRWNQGFVRAPCRKPDRRAGLKRITRW